MQIDDTVHSPTDLNTKTLSINLRCLHSHIKSFNDMALFLFQCNMDIKYIGSKQQTSCSTGMLDV
ncbi:hypothetical protein PAXRUDRAFT_132704 [Paxillus rubicundulus Ve08.2h10]|uniref:Uncharacterized protein n=1 Tax=Paxillus rubicundulus Ve08.2h10 TaxID=930991 RepID=A0A0D0ECD3_9AGAM|nr:hypothetical protein PAXRUDRAFT_132704 [Paxillus rubicundulus Ve08.2h10]